MTQVVVKVTESIVCQVDHNLDVRWKATCPLCKWKDYGDSRTKVELRLKEHLLGHRSDQEKML